MYPYQKELENRIDKLSKLITEKSAALQQAPQGALHISGKYIADKCISVSADAAGEEKKENIPYAQYYHLQSPGEKSGKYLHADEMPLVKALAQKQYDQKLLRTAQAELKTLLQLQKKSASPCAEEVYSYLSPRRKQLVTPIELTDQEYVFQWEKMSYTPKPFSEGTPEYYTVKGERVRSKSEVLIANTLTEIGIPYHYEKPLLLGSKIIHPDFSILWVKARKTLYLEHLGMMDDPEYAESAVSRINLYMQNQIFPGDQLLLTFETRNYPLNTRILKMQLMAYCNKD